MQKKLFIYTIGGIVFTSLLGTLAHFIYGWSDQNLFAGLFTPVNESTWEHMKLLFFPMLLYGIFACTHLGQDFPCISYVYPLGILAGTSAIPILFYTYTGILGKNYTPVDILIFYISVILAFFLIYKKTFSCHRINSHSSKSPVVPWLAVFLLAFCFLVFTVFPPSLGIFRDLSIY